MQTASPAGFEFKDMNEPQEITAGPLGKISLDDEGLGTVDNSLVEQRALEIAKTDGRTEANQADRATARTELLGLGNPATPPEAPDPAIEDIVEWDSPVDSNGHRSPKVLPEDEANIAEVLVEEGLEEADHNQRVSAANTNPPEEL